MTTVPFGPPAGAPEPDPFAEYDAAYVFGALSPDERTAYERHLQHCDDCSASVAAMAGIPGLLARVPLERLIHIDETPAPDTVLPRLVAQVSRERQRSRWRTGAVVLLAAACVVAVVVGALSQRHPVRSTAGGPTSASTSSGAQGPGSGPVLSMKTVRNVGVSASVQIKSVAWGTKITMRCTEAPTARGALPYSGVYYLLAVGTDGSRQSVADWHALPGKTVPIEGDTSLRRADISSLLLVDADREVLLKLDL
jgi:Putative zinc-finger